jgi:hypothetical protein
MPLWNGVRRLEPISEKNRLTHQGPAKGAALNAGSSQSHSTKARPFAEDRGLLS